MNSVVIVILPAMAKPPQRFQTLPTLWDIIETHFFILKVLLISIPSLSPSLLHLLGGFSGKPRAVKVPRQIICGGITILTHVSGHKSLCDLLLTLTAERWCQGYQGSVQGVSCQCIVLAPVRPTRP